MSPFRLYYHIVEKSFFFFSSFFLSRNFDTTKKRIFFLEKSNTITSSSETDHQSPTTATNFDSSAEENDDDEEDDDCTIIDNNQHSQTTFDYNVSYHSTFSSTKWQTKLFAIDCIQKLLIYCEQTPQSNLHFNSISAKEHIHTYPNEDYLIQHLNILITFSYMACKSTNDQLNLSGLSLLKQIILKFLHN